MGLRVFRSAGELPELLRKTRRSVRLISQEPYQVGGRLFLGLGAADTCGRPEPSKATPARLAIAVVRIFEAAPDLLAVIGDPAARIRTARSRTPDNAPRERARSAPCAGCRRPIPVVTAMYCLPSTLKVSGKPCTDVAEARLPQTLPVFTSTARKSRSMSPTNAMPPAVDRIGGHERRTLFKLPVLLQRADVVGRQFPDVAVDARDLEEAPAAPPPLPPPST